MQVVRTIPELPGTEYQFYRWPAIVLESERQNLAILSTRPIQEFPAEDLLLYCLRLCVSWGAQAQTDPAQWAPRTANPPTGGARPPSFYEMLRAWGGAMLGLSIAIERLIAEDKTRLDDMLPSPALVLAHTTAAGVPLGNLLTGEHIVNLFQRATFPSGVRRSEIMVADTVAACVELGNVSRNAAYVTAGGTPSTLLTVLDERAYAHILRFVQSTLASGTTVIADPDTESRAIRIMAQRATRLHAVACTFFHLAAAAVRDTLAEYSDWLATEWVATRLPGQVIDEILRAMAVQDVVGKSIPGSPFAEITRPINTFDPRISLFPTNPPPMPPNTRPTTRLALGNPLLQYVDYDTRILPASIIGWINAVWDLNEYMTQITADLAATKNTPLGSSKPFTVPVGTPRVPAYVLRSDTFQPRSSADPYDLWPSGGALGRVVDNWSLALSTEVRTLLPTAYVPAYYYQPNRKAVQQRGTIVPICTDLEPLHEEVAQVPGLVPSTDALAMLWGATPADLSAFVLRSAAEPETALAYALAHTLRYIGIVTAEKSGQSEVVLEPPTREWWFVPTSLSSYVFQPPNNSAWLGDPLIIGRGNVTPAATGGAQYQMTVRLYPFRWMCPLADVERLPDMIRQIPDEQALGAYHKPRYTLFGVEAAVRAFLAQTEQDAIAAKLPMITHWRSGGQELNRIYLARCLHNLAEHTVVTGIKNGDRERPDMSWHPVQVLAVTDDDFAPTGYGYVTLPESEWFRS